MATSSANVSERLNSLEKNNKNLGELIRYLRGMGTDDSKILELAHVLAELCILNVEVNILKISDSASKIISTIIVAIFSNTSPASAAFLSSAGYFLVDKIVTRYFHELPERSLDPLKIENLDMLCKLLLEQTIYVAETISGDKSPQVDNMIRNMKKRAELTRKDLDCGYLFHFGSMFGGFIGATIGADFGFGWLGRSILNFTGSVMIGACCYTFWNKDAPNSIEQSNRPHIPKPIL